MKYIIEDRRTIRTAKGRVLHMRGTFFRGSSALATHWGSAGEAQRFPTREAAERKAREILISGYHLQKCFA